MLVIRESVHTSEFCSNFDFKLYITAGYSSVNSYVDRRKRWGFGGAGLGNVAACNANTWPNSCLQYELRCCCYAITE